MKLTLLLAVTALLPAALAADPQFRLTRDIPYATPAHERQVLDVYAPLKGKNLPVVFWIHGGGWQTGDKSSVQQKPQVFVEKGFVFVSTNHRLLPHVEMGAIIHDIAKSLRWVYENIAAHGGDPQRVLVMGHSSGAQLAALLCTDARYLAAEGVPFSILKGCVPVDGDTYDLPAIIATGETRRRLHGQPEPKYGHRLKFGTDQQHIDYSAVTHIARNKGIPPFLILHVAEHPDTTAQAQRLGAVLKAAGIYSKVFGAPRGATHSSINANLGIADDPCTRELMAFVDMALKLK
jgi:arylformamidase